MTSTDYLFLNDSATISKEVNDFLTPNPTASFPIRLRGEALKDAGIVDGDLLFIDRSVKPKEGSLILAYLDSHFVVRRLRYVNGTEELHAENEVFPVLHPSDYDDFSVEGVAVSCAKRFF